MLGIAGMEDIKPPSTGLPESLHRVKASSPLTLLDDFIQDETGRKQVDIQKIFSNFYKGAPLNLSIFSISKELNTFLVQRDSYEDIIKQIEKCQKLNHRVSCINISHEPGSGGSTLAMQIFWDLRKNFKCAIKKETSDDIALITDHVVDLFKNHEKPVLLLVDNCNETFVESLDMEIEKRKIKRGPVAILLNTWRNSSKRARCVVLKTNLSSKELHRFELKEEELKMMKGDEEIKLFHGFNLMRHNFSEKYVADLSSIKEAMEYVKENKTSCNTDLFSILALLNSYVPGSFLPLSRCQNLINPQNTIYEQTADERDVALQDPPVAVPGTGADCQIIPDTISKQLQFEKTMQPFMDLIVIFSRDDLSGEFVRLSHPMIAKECLKKLNMAGITKGEITKRFLESCKPNESSFMMKLIKHMLIKRETVDEHKLLFSSLILDMKNEGDIESCVKILEIATNKFEEDAFFPQAFARFLYIICYQYEEAEHQAKLAIGRDTENSFVIDTLGQVHKHHLQKLKNKSASQILEVADLAIKAFRKEEHAAEQEQDPNTSKTQSNKVSDAFNCSGLFGYIQVAKIIFDYLTALDLRWSDVLIRQISLSELKEAKNILHYDNLIENLQDNVAQRHDFFEIYMTYSKPSRSTDPQNLQKDLDICYSMYLLRNVKSTKNCHSIVDRSFPGLLSCLDRGYCNNFLERIVQHMKKLYDAEDNETAALKYILSNIILSNRIETSDVLHTLTGLRDILWKFVKKENIYQSPEFFLIVLLLFWPDEEHHHVHYNLDINNTVENMKAAFDQKYYKYLRCRYLRPLFFLGKGTGLKRLIHSWKIYHVHTTTLKNPKGKIRTWANLNWRNEKLWEDNNVQKVLLHVNGVFRNQQLFAYAGDKMIEVLSDQSCVAREGPVSFFLGFNIKGPVAYNIKSEYNPFQDQSRLFPTCWACTDAEDFAFWNQLHPQVWSEDGDISTDKSEKEEYYRISCVAGSYECTLTGLRWVCDSDVVLKYRYLDWEPYREVLERMQYEPRGPTLDITVISGALKEVHLPHFICLGSSIPLNDAAQVLDMQDSGMNLEPCELTRFHAKLYNPTFSPKSFLIKAGLSSKIHCEVLIYQMRRAPLTLHVYLVPIECKLSQAVEKVETDAVRIRKPRPDRSLPIKKLYKLETKKGNVVYPSSITPQNLKLRYDPTIIPNYFEVYLKCAKDDFELQLFNEDKELVWTAQIRAEEYGKEYSPQSSANWFYKKHEARLIQRVSLVHPIADDLKSLIGNEKYSIIITSQTSQEKMRKLCSFISGEQEIFTFFNSLKKHEPLLVQELENER